MYTKGHIYTCVADLLAGGVMTEYNDSFTARCISQVESMPLTLQSDNLSYLCSGVSDWHSVESP